jgi:hypothetical protein
VLTEQLRRPESWSAASAAVPQIVQLRPEAAKDAVAVHPLAQLCVRQDAVPLETPLQRMDGVRLPREVVLRITTPGGPATGPAPRAPFVPARFFDLDAAAALASGAAADLPAGVELGATPPPPPPSTSRPWSYEQKVLARSRRSLLSRRLLATEVAAAALPPPRLTATASPVVVREPHMVVATVAGLSDATQSATAALASAGGTAAVLATALQASAVGAATTAVEARSVVGALAAAGTVGLQAVAAWEVAP